MPGSETQACTSPLSCTSPADLRALASEGYRKWSLPLWHQAATSAAHSQFEMPFPSIKTPGQETPLISKDSFDGTALSIHCSLLRQPRLGEHSGLHKYVPQSPASRDLLKVTGFMISNKSIYRKHPLSRLTAAIGLCRAIELPKPVHQLGKGSRCSFREC